MKKTNVIATTGFWLMLVTIGGAFFAVMATADSLGDYVDGLRSIVDAYKKVEVKTDQMSQQILELSDTARKEGAVLANWICIPTARKLEKSSAEETLAMEIAIEGVLSIQAGENSRIIKEKIKSIMEMEEDEAA